MKINLWGKETPYLEFIRPQNNTKQQVYNLTKKHFKMRIQNAQVAVKAFEIFEIIYQIFHFLHVWQGLLNYELCNGI